MKITYLSHRIPFPPNKGEKIRTFHQIKYLVEQGYDVSVIAPYQDESELAYYDQLKQQFGVTAIGIKLKYKMLRLALGIMTTKPLSVANFYSRRLQKIVDNKLATNEIDVLICTASSMAEYVFKSEYFTSTQAHTRLYMDFMDLDSDKWRQYAAKTAYPQRLIYQREARLMAQYENKTSDLFNACFFITDTETNLFKAQYPQAKNIFSVENGIDTTMFKPSETKNNSKSPILLFTGVMDYSPNIDAVVWFVKHVWPNVIEKWPTAEFYIAGMNPTEKVRALADNKGIKVTGFVEDILPYYHKSTIFVAPFRIARGVQNKVLQAFACGIPVVSSPMGAEGIRCTNEQDILIAKSPEDYFEHIVKLTENPSLMSEISAKALDTIQRLYSWQGVLAPFMQIITQALPSNTKEITK